MVATENQVRRIVRDFIRVLEPKIRVERVVLFGSYAHKRANEWSDIDVAILSSDFERWSPIAVIDEIAKRRVACDSRLAPVAYTPAQFDNSPPYAFAAEIRRTGKVIYDARKKRARKQVSTKQRRSGKKVLKAER